MPKTYMKYPNILNIHKSFQVLWVPNRVWDMTQTGTEIRGPKRYRICTLPMTETRTKSVYIFGLVSDLVFQVRQTVESFEKVR